MNRDEWRRSYRIYRLTRRYIACKLYAKQVQWHQMRWMSAADAEMTIAQLLRNEGIPTEWDDNPCFPPYPVEINAIQEAYCTVTKRDIETLLGGDTVQHPHCY